MGFEEKEKHGPLQFIKNNRGGRIHILLDAQDRYETRIRIHQDIIAASQEGQTYHYTRENDYTPAAVFSQVEQALYAEKMKELRSSNEKRKNQ